MSMRIDIDLPSPNPTDPTALALPPDTCESEYRSAWLAFSMEELRLHWEQRDLPMTAENQSALLLQLQLAYEEAAQNGQFESPPSERNFILSNSIEKESHGPTKA